MKNKITKQDIWTEVKILNAKLDLILDLLQEKQEIELEPELEEFFRYVPAGDLDVQ